MMKDGGCMKVLKCNVTTPPTMKGENYEQSKLTLPMTPGTPNMKNNNNNCCSRHRISGTWSMVSTDRVRGKDFGYVKVKRKVLRCHGVKTNEPSEKLTTITAWLRFFSTTNKKMRLSIEFHRYQHIDTDTRMKSMPMPIPG